MKDRRARVLRTLAVIGLSCSFFFGQAQAVTKGLKVTIQDQTSGTSKEVSLYSGYHALIVGISDYRQPWQDIPGALEDAQQVYDYFQSIGWDVNLLENPTGQKLRRALNEIIAGPGKDPQKAIFFWFSGHGYTMPQADGTPKGFLVPSNAPDPIKDESGFRQVAIGMPSLVQTSEDIHAKHVLMMFDSCFSGTIFKTRSAINPSHFIQYKTLKKVRQFIAAGEAEESVPDESIFHEVFLQGLRDKNADLNRDGYVTGEELGLHLQENVVNYTESAQHPQYAKIRNPKLDKGDFVFVLPSVGAPKPPDLRVLELELWTNIRDSNDPRLFKDFLKRFPNGIFSGLAKLRLSEEDSQTSQRFRAGLVNQANVRVLGRPDASGAVIAMLDFNTPIKIIGSKGNWKMIQSPSGLDVWVWDKFIDERDATATVNRDYVRIRSRPSTNERSDVLGVLYSGTKATVVGRKGDWVKLRIFGAVSGWIDRSQVKTLSTVSDAWRVQWTTAQELATVRTISR